MRYPEGAKRPTKAETEAFTAELAAELKLNYPKAPASSDAEAVALFLFNSLKDA